MLTTVNGPLPPPPPPPPPPLQTHPSHRLQVNELLDTEEDMVDLYLTSKVLTGHRRETHEHVEAELLLEMYARQLQKILNECSMIADKIEATEQQVALLRLLRLYGRRQSLARGFHLCSGQREPRHST